MLRQVSILTLTTLALASCNMMEATPIRVTGSSTVFPFTKAVADAFVRKDAKRPAPLIESVGTGTGVQTFCAKASDRSPDILDASRRMTRAEYTTCKANGYADILEVRIGLDGIALAESSQGPKLSLTSKDLYLALAANPNGKPNTAKSWHDVNPDLPDLPILVLGPPKSSGTHDMFVSLIMRIGCLAAVPEAVKLSTDADPSKFDAACLQIRTDGVFVEEGEDDEKIVAALEKNPHAVGLFGYSYLERNAAKLRAVPIDGVAPDAESIAGGKYIGCRLLYLYVKKNSIRNLPALKDFLTLYLDMGAPGGPLTRVGLIAASAPVRKEAAEAVRNEFPLDPLALM